MRHLVGFWPPLRNLIRKKPTMSLRYCLHQGLWIVHLRLFKKSLSHPLCGDADALPPHSTPYTLHLPPHTRPYTLHPTPHTPHPTPHGETAMRTLTNKRSFGCFCCLGQ